MVFGWTFSAPCLPPDCGPASPTLLCFMPRGPHGSEQVCGTGGRPGAAHAHVSTHVRTRSAAGVKTCPSRNPRPGCGLQLTVTFASVSSGLEVTAIHQKAAAQALGVTELGQAGL